MAQGQGGGAIPGNQYGVKLKDPDIRQIAYQSFCDHIAKGKSKDSWYFEHEQLTCTYKTFQKYLQNEEEFPPIKKEIAYNKGFEKWEAITESSATGADKKKSNTASLQMVMRNKFGWDKNQKESEATVEKQDDWKEKYYKSELEKLEIQKQLAAQSKTDPIL